METAGRPSGFAPAALSCLWASALTRVSGCPRHGEVRTAGEEPLAVLKPTGWQFLNRTGEGLFLEVQADGSCTGGILAASGRARCRGTPSLASGGAPGAGPSLMLLPQEVSAVGARQPQQVATVPRAVRLRLSGGPGQVGPGRQAGLRQSGLASSCGQDPGLGVPLRRALGQPWTRRGL